ncbi:putative metallopeptidase [Sinorhizobium garamanticum]|uniref:Metallopeptidase n=1 Tax=Sinorhizobium garamanticum TaxID=680247 RepID=A0ABY8DAC1_9HYPH|nr:putative metallopeptidase [Sinorhizobium garamanticum]WEX86485.1 putative metallopeptidase [Sinorhizobium garamanticum]
MVDLSRPQPSESMFGVDGSPFKPALDMPEWVEATFLDSSSPLHNPEHTHRSIGRPIFAIRGHDAEEFVGVVRRYGADAAAVRAMVDAANQKPEIARVQIAHACDTCQLRVALSRSLAIADSLPVTLSVLFGCSRREVLPRFNPVRDGLPWPPRVF